MCTSPQMFFFSFVLVVDWANLVPFFALVGGAGYAAYRAVKPKSVSTFVKNI